MDAPPDGSALRLSIEDEPGADDLGAVRRGLYEYNRGHAGDDHYWPLAVFLRDEAGAVVAGLTGCTFWEWLYVDLLWVREERRGQGIGEQLLRSAEEEAVRRGCRGAFLDTLSFQALPFYLKQGYSVFGELPDMPPGHIRHYVTKRFDEGRASDG